MNSEQKIFITGHRGMVGSAFARFLEKKNYTKLIFATKKELNLCSDEQLDNFFIKHKPEVVIMTAAKVGGISANIANPYEFLIENLKIQNNLFSISVKHNVKEIIFLGSSCIYPANCPQPMKEQYLLNGPLEATNEGYALAKITGLKIANYISKQFGIRAVSFMPCNLYGTNDHFDLNRSHVLSSLVKKFVDAVDNNKKTVQLLGTGEIFREFMHVDDLVEAIFIIHSKIPNGSYINIGSGTEISIKELANRIAKFSNYQGEILWDISKPDGIKNKLLDNSLMIKYGFKPKISLDYGIKKTINEYKEIKKLLEINIK